MEVVFHQAARDELAGLKRRQREVQREIKGLEVILSNISAAISHLDAYLRVSGAGAGGHDESAPLLPLGVAQEIRGMGLGDAVVFVLRGRPWLKKAEIVQALHDEGYKIGGSDPNKNLGSTLYTLKQAGKIDRDDNGRYTVAKNEVPTTT